MNEIIINGISLNAGAVAFCCILFYLFGLGFGVGVDLLTSPLAKRFRSWYLRKKSK